VRTKRLFQVININIADKYAGTTGTMLHEFKHADQYRTGDLGFYVNDKGTQVSSTNTQELERAANYRGDVYSFGKSTPTLKSYNLQGYGHLERYTGNTGQYKKVARDNGWKYIGNY
jgi:hypothetical protein